MALRAKDIAEMLGVSTATVSLVLNNKPGVGDQKRQDRKSTRQNSSHIRRSRMPSSA
mgnify:CR=1 FL=1